MKMDQLANEGALPPKPWNTLTPEEIERILDPQKRTELAGSTPEKRS